MRRSDPGPIIETGRSAPSPHALRLITVTSLAHFVNDGVVFFVPVIGDLLAQADHASAVLITAMLTVFYVFSAGVGIGVGLVSDALGRRGTMIALGITGLAVSLFAFYLALSVHGTVSEALVIVGAVIAGFGSAFYHPLVKKPIDVSLAAADRLIAAASGAGVSMTVISQHRFDPGPAKLRRLLDDSALGRLVLGEAVTKWHRTQGYYDSAGWRGTWALDGGSLLNQGIHYVDLLRWCLGPVAEVCAVMATRAHRMEAEDIALATLRFRSGALGTIVTTTAAFPGSAQRLEITGTAGTVVIEDGEITRLALAAGPGPGAGNGAAAQAAASDAAAIGARAHAAQLADMLAAIDSGREPSVTGQDGRAALELACAVYESARRGRPVALGGPSREAAAAG